MGHFPFLQIKLKFQWVITTKFNIAPSVLNGQLSCWMGLCPHPNHSYLDQEIWVNVTPLQ